MAGQGAGPSRRSHTKSRKGCKTCKRRHIRCDETFPQCRNCTKHQVRCDYMDAAPSDSDSQSQTSQTCSTVDSSAEETIRLWQQTGIFPYRELEVYPAPQVERLSWNELYFIHNLSSITESLIRKGFSNLTIWTHDTAKSISLASSYPFVMHALHSFSANNLAFTSQSSDWRKLSYHHGGVALHGLHDAISNFSASNADGVLAASLLLASQATDYRSWSSLESGIRSVVRAMQCWRGESQLGPITDVLAMQAQSVSEGSTRAMPTPQQRYNVLRSITGSLHGLRPFISGNRAEEIWLDQIVDYVARLEASEPAQTAEEQFNHLYALRKWTYWLPAQLLDSAGNGGPGMLVVAYLYATTLALEPLFPDIGCSFCTGAVLKPLEEVIARISPVQSHQGYSEHSLEIASIMQFPRDAVHAYRERNPWTARRPMTPNAVPSMNSMNSFHFEIDASNYGNAGNISPAFTPTQLHLAAAPQMSTRSHSPLLELPTAQFAVPSQVPGFTHGTGQWGAQPSPAFPHREYGTVMEDQSEMGTFVAGPFGGFGGGCSDIDESKGYATSTLPSM